jgi:hypothetical protein
MKIVGKLLALLVLAVVTFVLFAAPIKLLQITGATLDTTTIGTTTWGDGTADTDIVWTFDGESNDGTFGYYEDEDEFRFSDKVRFDEITNFTQTTALGSVLAVMGNVPAGGTAAQSGWITVEVGGATRYVPYWE